MPNTETVRALVSAFNVHNYARNTIKTNFTLRSEGKKDYIVVSFDKGMQDYQCSEYLYNIKRKIVGEFYGIEEGDTDEVVLNTAKLIFDVKSFPFNDYKGDWSVDKQGRIEFVAPIDQGVIFNLKSHLASSLKKDVLEDMSACRIVTKASNKKDYLWHGKFDNKESREEFEREFLSRMENRYGCRNGFKNPLKVEGNSVYIKDVFDDARFIDSVTRRAAWLIGRDLQANSKSRSNVRAFKDLIIEIPYPSTHVVINAFLCASPLNREEASILIPVTLSNRGVRFLTTKEASDINHKFSNPVLDDISDKTQATFKVNGSSEIYGIDFSNKEISHCVITKIIESSVINKDHELSIDPELPRTLLTEPSQSQESPTRNKSVALKDSPRQGSKEDRVLPVVKLVDVPGMSREFPPRSHLSSSVTNPHSPKCVSAAQNVQARTSAWTQPMNHLSSQGTSGNEWTSSTQSTQPGPSNLSWTSSGPSSSKRPTSVHSIESGYGSLEPGQSPSLIEKFSDSSKRKPSLNTVPGISKSGEDPSVEDVNDVEPEKQQVSDECSEAKSQESKSPKKRLDNFLRSFSLNFQQRGTIKRNGPGRGTTQSATFSSEEEKTEKPPSKQFSSVLPSEEEKNVKLVKVTPLNDLNDSIPGSPSQGAVGKLNVPRDRSSKISVDSGLVDSLKRGQSPPLTEEFSGSSQQNLSIGDKLGNIFSGLSSSIKNLFTSPTSPTHKGVPGGLNQHQKKELRKVLSDEMKKKLDSGFFPLGYEKLLYLLYVDKRELRLLLSDPKAKEQVCSVLSLSPEKMEQVQSGSPEEVLRLLHSFFSNQKISEDFFIGSKVDSPKSEQLFAGKEKGVFV